LVYRVKLEEVGRSGWLTVYTWRRSVVWLSMRQPAGGWGGPAAVTWKTQSPSFMLPISFMARHDSSPKSLYSGVKSAYVVL
jgi:hypothetical protein